MTAERFAACQHVVASPKRDATGPVDQALERLGLRREVVVVVPGFPDAMRIVRHSDLIAHVPRSCLGNALVHEPPARAGLQPFELPVRTPRFAISAMWHPRTDADPGRRWLLQLVTSLARTAYPASRRRSTPAS